MCDLIAAICLGIVSSFHIGNSLTNDGLGNHTGNVQSGVFGIEAMADFYGYDYLMSMHIDAKQGLTGLWNTPNGMGPLPIDLKRQPYGNYTNALTGYGWDQIVLQPFAMPGETFGSDKLAIANFINLAHQNAENVDAVFYIYQVWPRQSLGNYSTYWLSESLNDDATLVRAKRQYYDNMMNWTQETYTANGTLVREIPTGEVWHRINLRIESGEISGITMADLYRDDVHASGPLGRYVAAATIFATLFRTDIRGMPVPVAQFGTLYPQALYDQFNEVIWEVVSSDPDTGIADFNNDGWVNGEDLTSWQEGYAPGGFTGRDFLNWQRSYHFELASQLQMVPEPKPWVLLCASLLGLAFASRRMQI